MTEFWPATSFVNDGGCNKTLYSAILICCTNLIYPMPLRSLTFISRAATSILRRVENAPLSPALIIITFVSVLSLRIVSESLIASGNPANPNATDSLALARFMTYEFFHFFFLLVTMLGLLFGVFTRILRYEPSKTIRVLLCGLLLFILAPPILDETLFRGFGISSYYEFYGLRDFFVQFFTFMSLEPFIGTTPGQRIIIFLALVGLIPFAHTILSRHNITGLRLFFQISLFIFLTYSIFYLAATAPSVMVLVGALFSGNLLLISDAHIAQFFFGPLLSPPHLVSPDLIVSAHFKMALILLWTSLLTLLLLCYLHVGHVMKSLVANMRPAQILYHCTLLLLGIMLGAVIRDYGVDFSFFNILIIMTALLATVCAWLSSVTVNDLWDARIDHISNPHRPLISGTISAQAYTLLGFVLAALSLSLSFFLNFYVGMLFLGYMVISFLYSAPPLRLKQYPLIATATAALASLIIVFAGYALTVPEHTTYNFPTPIGWLLFLSLTFCLPIKDLKDIDGDRADNVMTLPVLLGAYRARLLIAVSFFASYITSPFLFRDLNLFIPALLCGSFSFFVIIWQDANRLNNTSTTQSEYSFHFRHQTLLLALVLIALFYCAFLAGRITL